MVAFVQFVGIVGEFALPELLALAGVDGEDEALAGLVGGGDVDVLAPGDRAGVAAAGQRDFPEVILVGPGDGEFRRADARAIGAAEARPVLGLRSGGHGH